MESKIENTYRFKVLSDSSSIILDALRALCSQSVVFFHGIVICGTLDFLAPPMFPYLQSMSVMVFFILSGFIITYTVEKKIVNNKNYDFIEYFIERFSRIYSVLIPILCFIALSDVIAKYYLGNFSEYLVHTNLKTFVSNLLMFQNTRILSTESFGTGRPLWTLNIEWWIYMAYGYFVLEILINRQNSLFKILVLLAFSGIPLLNMINAYGLTLSWILGLVAYKIYSKNLFLIENKKILVAIVIVLFMLIVQRIIKTNGGYDHALSILMTMQILLLIYLFSEISIPLLIKKIVKIFASFSFSLYLIHYTIFTVGIAVIKNTFDKPNLFLAFLFLWLLTNFLSFLSGYFLENKATHYVKKKLLMYKMKIL